MSKFSVVAVRFDVHTIRPTENISQQVWSIMTRREHAPCKFNDKSILLRPPADSSIFCWYVVSEGRQRSLHSSTHQAVRMTTYDRVCGACGHSAPEVRKGEIGDGLMGIGRTSFGMTSRYSVSSICVVQCNKLHTFHRKPLRLYLHIRRRMHCREGLEGSTSRSMF